MAAKGRNTFLKRLYQHAGNFSWLCIRYRHYYMQLSNTHAKNIQSFNIKSLFQLFQVVCFTGNINQNIKSNLKNTWHTLNRLDYWKKKQVSCHPTYPQYTTHKWDKVFKNGPSKICGTHPLENLKRHGLLEADHIPSNFLKAVIHKFYLVHSWILCPK